MFIIGVEVQGKENRTLRCVTEMGSRRLANRKKKKLEPLSFSGGNKQKFTFLQELDVRCVKVVIHFKQLFPYKLKINK